MEATVIARRLFGRALLHGKMSQDGSVLEKTMQKRRQLLEVKKQWPWTVFHIVLALVIWYHV